MGKEDKAKKTGKAQEGQDKNEGGKLIDRRGFLGGTLAGLGSLGLWGCGAEARKEGAGAMPIWGGDVKAKMPAGEIPTTAKPNGLNMIVIIVDTWRADHLGCYGNKRVKTPNLDKLSDEGVQFNNTYTEGLPTIPSRRVYHTGRSVLPETKWQPLEKNDTTFAEVLSKHGVTTGFIADTFHYFKPDYNFHRYFDSWEWIRGQNYDRWKIGPRDKVDPRKHIPEHFYCETYERNIRQYLMNTLEQKNEEDYFCAQSCRAAMEWLELNGKNSPFMLWLDMFETHEPWDAPERFAKMYRAEYPLERYLFGYGAKWQNFRQEDLPVLKDLYAAEVAFSDYWIGKLLDRVREMGLMENTVIVFSTDHGTHLGENGCLQKQPIYLNWCVTHIPLIIKHPDSRFAGRKVNGLVSAIDFMPTFLKLMGIDDYQEMDGGDMWPMAAGQKQEIHDCVYSAFKDFGAVRQGEWYYFQNIRGDNPGKGPGLFNMKDTSTQDINAIKEHPEIARKLREKLQNHVEVAIPPLKI